MVVRYSPEIQLQLTIQEDCKGRVAGRVYYRRILRAEDKHRKRGDRLTPIIEKGLRKPSVAEVIAAVEITAMDERIIPAVVDDVLSYYSGRLHELSLKTAWYCLRSILLTKYSYNGALVVELFSMGSWNSSGLIIGKSYPDDYDAAMAEILREKGSAPYKYWEQLNLILNTAKSEGYISYNPLAGHMATVSARLTKRQQDVRNALTKKRLNLMRYKICCIIFSTLHLIPRTTGWQPIRFR